MCEAASFGCAANPFWRCCCCRSCWWLLCCAPHTRVQDVTEEMPTFNVSYKPQKISPKFEGSVRQLLHKKIRDSYLHPQVRPRALTLACSRGVCC